MRESHAPPDYVCPFCRFAANIESRFNALTDIVYSDADVFAFISPRQWTIHPGNVLVVPRRHYETLYTLPDPLLARVAVVSKRVALAMKSAYECDGVSLRQHNEPAGDQDVWHFHVHVLPRSAGDDLHRQVDQARFVSASERRVYADRLKAALAEPNG